MWKRKSAWLRKPTPVWTETPKKGQEQLIVFFRTKGLRGADLNKRFSAVLRYGRF